MSDFTAEEIAAIVPFIIPEHEAATLQQLAGRPGLSDATLRRMNRKYRICQQATRNAPLLFSRPAVAMVRHGDLDALFLFKSGDRQSARVRGYLEMLGLA